MAKVKMVTVKGIAVYPKLKTVDMYKGEPVGYTIQLRLDAADGADLAKNLDAFLVEEIVTGEHKGKKFAKEPSLGYKVEDVGTYLFRFKMKHEFLDKETGEIIKRSVPVFDANGNTITNDIGHDSVVKVNFTPIVYYNNAMMNGLSLRLNAVQVFELKEFFGSNNAKAFGFDSEDPEFPSDY